jgi:hypothetical protein
MTQYDKNIELNPTGVLLGIAIFVVLATVTVGFILFGTAAN